MVASRYTHFKDESLEWHRALSFVSDVMTMLNGTQVGQHVSPLFCQIATGLCKKNVIVGWLPNVVKCSPPSPFHHGRQNAGNVYKLVLECRLLQSLGIIHLSLQRGLVPLTILQQMWSYLEPLFIHSEEVKKELPLDTKRFEKIDSEVKAMLTELWTVKKVHTLCNK